MRRLGGIVALGSIILMTLLLSACGNGAPPVPPLSAEEIIDRASLRMGEVNSFRFELTHEGGATPIVMGLEMTKAVGIMTRPGKLQATVSATVSGLFIEIELITVGQTTYITNPLSREKEWQPLPIELSAVGLFDPDSGVAAVMRGLTDLIVLDPGKVGGILSYHLRGKIDSSDLRFFLGSSVVEGIPITTEVWIGSEDFLLRQARFEGQITEGEATGIIRTLKLSDFDQPVTIELPQ